MRIESVSVTNLRCINQSTVNLDPYTCLVGPNGAGKSTLLCALNIFFRNSQGAANDYITLSSEDFHHQNVKQPLEITVTFTDLEKAAEDDFKGYVRQGRLTITASAIFDPNNKTASVLQYGERLGMVEFAPFFKAQGDKAKAGELRLVYDALREKHTFLPVWKSVDAAAQALRAHEAAKPEDCTLLRSADQFYGATKGAGLLEKYIQWVYIPAVKDAAEEEVEGRNTALGTLLSRTVRKKVDFEGIVKKSSSLHALNTRKCLMIIKKFSRNCQMRLRSD